MIDKEITFDRFVRILAVVLIILAVLWLVNYLSAVLLPFFVGWVLAYLLNPLVNFVEHKMHVPTRALSIIVALLFVAIMVAAVIYFIVPPMIEQFQRLGEVTVKYLNPVYVLHPARLRQTLQRMGAHLPQERTPLLAGPDEGRGRRTQQLYPRTGHGGLLHGREVRRGDGAFLQIRESAFLCGQIFGERHAADAPDRRFREQMIINGSIHDLLKCHLDDLTGPGFVQGGIDKHLKMRLPKIRHADAIQRGEVLPDHVLIHGLSVPFPDGLIGPEPFPAVIQEKRV